MVTIKEVAKKANVSIATVSAVINKNKFVSDDLISRVEEAINDLGYRPNKVARSLKKKETNLIGVMVTEITNPFYPLMFKGVEDVAIDSGYSVMLCTTGDDPKKENFLLQSMIDQGVDGIILATVDDETSESITLLNSLKIPYVLINRSPRNYEGTMVRINSCKVGEMAAEYLLESGHQDICFIGGDRLNSWEREKGFTNVLSANGIQVDESRLIRSGYSIEEAYKDVRSFIQKGNLPTAMFAASDVMAFGAIKAILDSGLKVPEDISVIGSDNISFSEDFLIPLTTIDAQTYDVGKLGSEMMVEKLKNKDKASNNQLLLEPKIVERKSCKKIERKSDQ
ncbi:LacI family DNA-binding transcriptional regulator [Rossellomorea aquimaris]|uniref:LacI family DNA-binding transcriptional regulator n=1 Tax=Rossellomorea aquimaris TaxID=189382 RepID=UPI001CFCF449|nr:LacI family DNA-binding transcriptional regulator [Rossellomorea aquimaris]